MKKILLSFFLLSCPFVVWAQVGNKEILFPLSLATMQIDTTSIDRNMERVYVTVLQHPQSDPLIKEQLLDRFSKRFSNGRKRKEILDISQIYFELGCDCETNDLQIFEQVHEWVEKGKYHLINNHGMAIGRTPELFEWKKSSFESKGYSPNDAEIQLINSLCSKYVYKVDTATYTLDIEEIPSFIQEHPSAYLQKVEREKVECNLPYRELETFHNDTIAFLKYNFKERAICYRGKTLCQVLKDLQLTPVSYEILYKWPYANRCQGIKIGVDGLNDGQGIYIYWDELQLFDDLRKLNQEGNPHAWSPAHYNLLKNNIVKGVYVE